MGGDSEQDITFHSRRLAKVTVNGPGGTSRDFADVRVMVLGNGAIRVYRVRSFSNAVPFETVIAKGEWTTYDSYGH